MPLGIVIIMVATIFLLAGHGQELCFTLFLSRKWTLALFFALILSYMVSPYTFEGVSIIFAYSRSSAIFNSIVSILVFNSILIFRGGYSTLLAPSAFTAACLSCCISVVPILLSQKITVFRTRRIFQTEAGSSLHPLTGKKRKRFKK